MATFKVEIDTDNAAFEDWQSEVARILGKLIDKLDRDTGHEEEPDGKLMDINGNTVGVWMYRK